MNHLENLTQWTTKSTVEIVGHSIDVHGNEVVSAILTYPLIIHAEVMTHRMFSRNAASARAIPGAKYRNTVKEGPFIPYALQKKHSGMQGSGYLPEDSYRSAVEFWIDCMEYSVKIANYMDKAFDVTKQITNRMLAPYSWMRLLVTTGKEGLENFFELRCHEDAEIHIMELAHNLKKEYDKSVPKKLGFGEWHIPFQEDIERMMEGYYSEMPESETKDSDYLQLMIEVAVGMAARTSYTLLPEEKDWRVYKRVHDKMLEMKPFHASPFEHVLQAFGEQEYYTWGKMLGLDDKGQQIIEYGWCDNFRGFRTYRNILEAEWKQKLTTQS